MEGATTIPPAEGSMTYHGKAFLAASIGRHPQRAAVVIGSLVVLSLILIVTTVVYRNKASACAPKSNFITSLTRYPNTSTGMMNPQWYVGSMDAGHGGSVDRNPTDYNVAAYNPNFRPNVQSWKRARYVQARLASTLKSLKRGEGFTPMPAGGTCAPGEYAMDDPTGQTQGKVCASETEYAAIATAPIDNDDYVWDASTCGRVWDPAAVAEAQAMATVGAVEWPAAGEKALDSALEAAYDTTASSKGLTDAQLTNLMRFGNAP